MAAVKAAQAAKATEVPAALPKVGIVIEESPGIPPYWEVAGDLGRGFHGPEIALRTEGSEKLRTMYLLDFLIAPAKGKKFKLAKIDGAGKFLPVDLKNIDGKLQWVLVID